MKGHILFAVFPSSSVINDVASGHGLVKWQYRACANLEGFFVVLQTNTKSSHATVLKETVYSFMPSQFLLPPFLIDGSCSACRSPLVVYVDKRICRNCRNRVSLKTYCMGFNSMPMAVKQQKSIFWCCQGSHTLIAPSNWEVRFVQYNSRFFLGLKGSLGFVEEPTGNYKEEKLECCIRGRGLQTLPIAGSETLS